MRMYPVNSSLPTSDKRIESYPNGTQTTRATLRSSIAQTRTKRAAAPKQEPNGKAEWLASIGGTARSDNAWGYVAKTCLSVAYNCRGKGETRGFYLDTPKQGTVKVRATRTLGHIDKADIADIANDAMIYAVQLAEKGTFPSFEGCVANADRRLNNGTQYPVRILYVYDANSETYTRFRGKNLPGVNAVRKANDLADKRGEQAPYVEFKVGVRAWGDAPPEQVPNKEAFIQTDADQRSMLAYAANIVAEKHGESGMIVVRTVLGGGTTADAARALVSVRGGRFDANEVLAGRIWAKFIEIAASIGEMAKQMQDAA